MTMIAFLGLSLIAASCFALVKPKHWKQVTGAARPGRNLSLALNGGGWLAVALAFVAAVRTTPDALIGGALWCGGLAAAGTLVALVLTYRAAWLRPVLAASLTVAALCGSAVLIG